MARLKRTQSWGVDENDDLLVRQILDRVKTATACPAEEYYLSGGDCEDGGFEVGDLVEVYDLKQQLRCIIKITEVYSAKFGSIPEKLWRGEGDGSADQFRRNHRACWPHLTIDDDFEMIINHFELVEAK